MSGPKIKDNTLMGGVGHDILAGTKDDETLIGGKGADVLSGGAGIDTADYSSSPVGVFINLDTGKSSGGDAEGDVLNGIENVTGSALKDVLLGDAKANVLIGNDGSDVLSGGAGDDTLQGGEGDDILTNSGGGNDTLDGGVGGYDRYLIKEAQGTTTIKDEDGGRIMFLYDVSLENATVTRKGQDLVITKNSDTDSKITVDLFFQKKDAFSFISKTGRYNIHETNGQCKFVLAEASK